MRASRGWRRGVSALVVALAAVTQAAPLELVAASVRAGAVSCACNGRRCCCPPSRGAASRTPCHGGSQGAPAPDAPTWRCQHSAPDVALPARAAVLAARFAHRWTPPATALRLAAAATTHAGFLHIDTPPPKTLRRHV